MADFYTAKQLEEIMQSHKQAVQTMDAASKNLGQSGIRAVQLWSMAKSLVDESEQLAAGAKLAEESLTAWENNKTYVVAGIDALAAGSGKTRQQILDELAGLPATNFGE